jgi:hypothetical protein
MGLKAAAGCFHFRQFGHGVSCILPGNGRSVDSIALDDGQGKGVPPSPLLHPFDQLVYHFVLLPYPHLRKL